MGDRVGLGARLDEQLPADAGQIEIIQSDELAAVQTMVRILKFLAYFVWVFAFLAWGLALFLARGRRRQTLRAIALAFLVLGLLVLLIRRIVGNRLVDRLVENESVRACNQGRLVDPDRDARVLRTDDHHRLRRRAPRNLAGRRAAAVRRLCVDGWRPTSASGLRSCTASPRPSS